MPRVPPFDRAATPEDLAQLPDSMVGEILSGELHANLRPSPRVASTAITLGGMLRRGLDPGGGPDSWQILPEPELRLNRDVLVPALAGWRLSRLPELPLAPYFSIAPDWACEVLAPDAAAAYRARKLSAYAAEGVSHVWLIDPVAQALEVRRLEGGAWRVAGTYVGSQATRAEPFEQVDLALGSLWPGPLDDRRPRRQR